MSTFDVELPVFSPSVNAPSEEALAAGAPPSVELEIVIGLGLPLANPQNGQPLVIGFGTLRFPFTREQAIETFRTALEAAEALPESFSPSGKVMTATSMADVARAAENIKRAIG